MKRQQDSLVIGLVGLSAVVIATVLSPTGFCGITLCVLVPLGFGGLALCAGSLAWKPRWPGVVGLVIGILCLVFWGGVFGWGIVAAQRNASRYGLSVGEHVQMLTSAGILVEAAESQRLPDGSPAPTFVTPAQFTREAIDPWGQPYRYTLTSDERGYTFISDGPDATAGTADDIDILQIQSGDMFPLPPISRPAGAGAATGGDAPGG